MSSSVGEDDLRPEAVRVCAVRGSELAIDATDELAEARVAGDVEPDESRGRAENDVLLTRVAAKDGGERREHDGVDLDALTFRERGHGRGQLAAEGAILASGETALAQPRRVRREIEGSRLGERLRTARAVDGRAIAVLRAAGSGLRVRVLEVGVGGLGAVRDPELLVDRGEVELHRVHGDVEPSRDLAVREALSDQLEDFDFASSQAPGGRRAHLE